MPVETPFRINAQGADLSDANLTHTLRPRGRLGLLIRDISQFLFPISVRHRIEFPVELESSS